MSLNKILLTGSSGFVGSRFLDLYPKKKEILPVSLQTTAVKDIDFTKVDTVLHCAGIAHRMEETDDQLYFAVNRDLTLKLAKAAKACGVKQFLFLSTIKVYGLDCTDSPITVHSSPFTPNDPYGQSKLEAEEGLRELESADFKVVILRPPLIYGPGAKGNLHRLMQLVDSKNPIPLGNIHNQRSMVYVDNLVAYLMHLMTTKASGVFLPADEPAISTTYLVQQLIQEINPSKRLITLPGLLWTGIKLLKPEFHSRLYGSLVVESSYPSSGFQQPYTIEEGLRAMAVSILGH